MIRRLMKSVREYKRPTVLTLIFIVGEAVIETFIPFITANLVNRCLLYTSDAADE